MANKVKWNGDKFNRQLRNATSVGLKRAAVFYHGKCRQAVAEPAPKTKHRRTRDTVAGKKGSQYTEYHPSQPGQPPHSRQGARGGGLSNIVHEYNGNSKDPATRVGVRPGGIHMIYLELGTRRIAARPWLLSTLKQYYRQIGMLAATGGKREIRG